MGVVFLMLLKDNMVQYYLEPIWKKMHRYVCSLVLVPM
jgi:hypothetical protein